MKPLTRWRCRQCGCTEFDLDECASTGCHKDIFSRGLCKAHYQKWYRRHTGQVVDEEEWPRDEAFWAQVDRYTAERQKL